VDIESFEATDDLTMEIWIKSAYPFRRSGNILGLTHIGEDDRDVAVYMIIKVENNIATCSPFRSLLIRSVLEMSDSNEKDKEWQHLSCSYSASNQVATATYLVDNQEYFYTLGIDPVKGK
jgi:hypothetical protein